MICVNIYSRAGAGDGSHGGVKQYSSIETSGNSDLNPHNGPTLSF